MNKSNNCSDPDCDCVRESVSNISEAAKDRIHELIFEFLESSAECTILPFDMPKTERLYFHRFIKKLGLVSRSYGKGSSRQIVLHKRLISTTIIEPPQNDYQVDSIRSINEIGWLVSRPKVDNSCWKTHKPYMPQDGSLIVTLTKRFIPKRFNASQQCIYHRQSLPIFRYRSHILHYIQHHRVIIVTGDTGSGKTTQVPQYILEEACRRHKFCRIICTQPRRIAAVTISERVAFERGEPVGPTVGYRFNLESCLRKTTNLIFTTSEWLIQSCIAGLTDTFNSMTHIILDEIHERDMYTDFLLIAIRDQLICNPELRVVLMSATMDFRTLCSYFGGCPVLHVPGRCFETRTFFLEDILYYTKYETAALRLFIAHCGNLIDPIEDSLDYVDNLIDLCSCRLSGSHYFDQLVYLYTVEGLDVNAQHSLSRRTGLMAAAIANNSYVIQKLLEMGADMTLVDEIGMTALDYSKSHSDYVSFDYLNSYGMRKIYYRKRKLLKAYEYLFSDTDYIDHMLILGLISMIHESGHLGSILVFLPGKTDIYTQKLILEAELPFGTFQIVLMHSGMKSSDQHLVLQVTTVRKIILATNVAETSITFVDVAFVIDTGRAKQKTYNPATRTTHLKSVWISKSSALQRAGRAGRTQTGICYRLYSQKKYESMPLFSVPEMLRAPLSDICLLAKLIIKYESIHSFFAKALDPPSVINIDAAIENLMTVGALDPYENITVLGKRLIDIPLDAPLGKSHLYSNMFRNLDSILTVVSYNMVKHCINLNAEGKFSVLVTKRFLFCTGSMIGVMEKDVLELMNPIRVHLYEWFPRLNASINVVNAIHQDIVNNNNNSIVVAMNNQNVTSKNWKMTMAFLFGGLYSKVCFNNSPIGETLSNHNVNVETQSTWIQPDLLSGYVQIRISPTEWAIFNAETNSGYLSKIKFNFFAEIVNIKMFVGTVLIMEDQDEVLEATQEPVIFTRFFVDDWAKFTMHESEIHDVLNVKARFSEMFSFFYAIGKELNYKIIDYFVFQLSKLFGLQKEWESQLQGKIVNYFAEEPFINRSPEPETSSVRSVDTFSPYNSQPGTSRSDAHRFEPLDSEIVQAEHSMSEAVNAEPFIPAAFKAGPSISGAFNSDAQNIQPEMVQAQYSMSDAVNAEPFIPGAFNHEPYMLEVFNTDAQNFELMCPDTVEVVPVNFDAFNAGPPILGFLNCYAPNFEPMCCEMVQVIPSTSEAFNAGPPILGALNCDAPDFEPMCSEMVQVEPSTSQALGSPMWGALNCDAPDFKPMCSEIVQVKTSTSEAFNAGSPILAALNCDAPNFEPMSSKMVQVERSEAINAGPLKLGARNGDTPNIEPMCSDVVQVEPSTSGALNAESSDSPAFTSAANDVEPKNSNMIQPEPPTSEAVEVNPTIVGSVGMIKAEPEPSTSEGVKADASTMGSVKSEQVKAEPSNPETVKPEPSSSEDSKFDSLYYEMMQANSTPHGLDSAICDAFDAAFADWDPSTFGRSDWENINVRRNVDSSARPNTNTRSSGFATQRGSCGPVEVTPNRVSERVTSAGYKSETSGIYKTTNILPGAKKVKTAQPAAADHPKLKVKQPKRSGSTSFNSGIYDTSNCSIQADETSNSEKVKTGNGKTGRGNSAHGKRASSLYFSLLDSEESQPKHHKSTHDDLQYIPSGFKPYINNRNLPETITAPREPTTPEAVPEMEFETSNYRRSNLETSLSKPATSTSKQGAPKQGSSKAGKIYCITFRPTSGSERSKPGTGKSGQSKPGASNFEIYNFGASTSGYSRPETPEPDESEPDTSNSAPTDSDTERRTRNSGRSVKRNAVKKYHKNRKNQNRQP